VYLRNAGTTSVSLGAASLQGFAASDFSLAADGCSGTGTAASVTGLRTGRTYTVVAYTVDKTGNVSSPVETSVSF
jgi:hypothetical protein